MHTCNTHTHRYATYVKNNFSAQWRHFCEATGPTFSSRCIAKITGCCELRKRGDWEENDDERVMEKMNRRDPAFGQFRLPNKRVVSISHKSYLDRYVCDAGVGAFMHVTCLDRYACVMYAYKMHA
jgi:hypothetical protein